MAASHYLKCFSYDIQRGFPKMTQHLKTNTKEGDRFHIIGTRLKNEGQVQTFIIMVQLLIKTSKLYVPSSFFNICWAAVRF